jgi:hypothetical protein
VPAVTQWWRRIFSNAKTHVYPLTLEPRLLRNWKDRGFKLHPGFKDAPADWPWTDVREASLLMGNGGFTDESWEVFKLPGLQLSIRAREVEGYLSDLEQLGVRSDLGRPYYKLHGWRCCLCMLPGHRDRLLTQLADRLHHAVAVAAAEAVEFNRRLRKCDEHPNMKVEQRLPEKKGRDEHDR